MERKIVSFFSFIKEEISYSNQKKKRTGNNHQKRFAVMFSSFKFGKPFFSNLLHHFHCVKIRCQNKSVR